MVGQSLIGHQLSKQWWDEDIPEEDRHKYITSWVDGLKNDQGYIDADCLKHLRLYANRNYRMDEYGFIEPTGSQDAIGQNVIKSVIDTKAAKIAAQRPRPSILTNGGKWKQRLKARKLEKYVMGVMHESCYYEKAEDALTDGFWAGTGFLKIFISGNRIDCERVFPNHIVVDEAAAATCPPRSLAQVENIPLESLCASFPEKRNQLLTDVQLHYSQSTGRRTSMARVYEIWHLPDENGKGGLHCICCDGITLLEEDWKHDFFPFVVFRNKKTRIGYFGSGIAESLSAKQEEIDYILGRLQVGAHNNATAWIIKHESDNVPNQHITNKMASIIEYSGNIPPSVVVHPIAHQQVFEQVKWLNQLCYEEEGVSHFSATSTKPAGIESGVALQKVLDVETTRHGPSQAEYERGAVQFSNIVLALSKEQFKGTKHKVTYHADNMIEEIDWSDVNMPEDEYRIKTWPVNLLPDTPAGKLDAVEKMAQAGMIDPQMAMMLLDFPDIESFQSLHLANLKNILWIVDQVVYEGNWVEPRVYHNLELGIKYFQMAAARAETEGAPPRVIDQCIEWMALANDLMAQPPPAPPPLGGEPPMDPAMGGMPPAPTMATPMEGAPPMEPGMIPPPGDPSMGGM